MLKWSVSFFISTSQCVFNETGRLRTTKTQLKRTAWIFFFVNLFPKPNFLKILKLKVYNSKKNLQIETVKRCLLLAPTGNVYAPCGWFRVGNKGIEENFINCKKIFCGLRGGTCRLSTPLGSAPRW